MKSALLLPVFAVFMCALLSPNAVVSAGELNVFKMAKYLDVNTLSRLIAFKQFVSNRRFELQPRFLHGWQYTCRRVKGWTRRLGIYGLGIAAIESHGDGNCLFYTIYTVFHLNNITNADLLELMRPELPEAVKVAIRGILESDEPVSPLNLKRISNIITFGGDPFDAESMETYDSGPFIDRLRNLADYQPAFTDARGNVDYQTTVFGSPSMIDIVARLDGGEDEMTVLREVYTLMENIVPTRLGDYTDKMNLEFAFQMFFLFLNVKNTAMSCGQPERDAAPKFIVPVLYHDNSHYDVAGIFKLGATDHSQIKTIFKVSEIPIPLLLILAEDCKLSH